MSKGRGVTEKLTENIKLIFSTVDTVLLFVEDQINVVKILQIYRISSVNGS